jgi:hypothetical protein
MRLRDGTTTTDLALDRLVQFDERSRGFPVRAIVPPEAPRERVWTLPRPYMGDQKDEGACVGYGISHALVAQPKPATLNVIRRVQTEHLIYWAAQRRDPWPGGGWPGATPQYEGTSVLAGLQVARDLGFYAAYRWAFSLQDVIQGILAVGPAILGLNWTEGMSHPQAGGLIEATGPVVGGHCLAGIGIDYNRRFPDGLVRDVIVLAQSWGLDHGDRGRVYLPLAQLAERLADDGECAFVTGRTGLQTL